MSPEKMYDGMHSRAALPTRPDCETHPCQEGVRSQQCGEYSEGACRGQIARSPSPPSPSRPNHACKIPSMAASATSCTSSRTSVSSSVSSTLPKTSSSLTFPLPPSPTPFPTTNSPAA
ncbi:hypothetical protein AXF42_Ash000131 [Apostasia shenzhenica]|uniref:Uncharacterized protein n=1 Tax=Apostasia shenzhenica TaxID=1088818 RepID=A0A2I0AFI6_9ASPA|nr:hypothetical protein AXF42_Ash000131 [Apostasia shenzhenica]